MPSSYSTSVNTQFAQDVLDGLSQKPRRLSSKYFYDAAGDKLFQDIMNMPEYYLTNCERDILQRHKKAILTAFNGSPFELIELGAGDGSKTKVLLEYFLDQEAHFEYRPIDISQNVLDLLGKDLRNQFPGLRFQVLQGDYFQMLHQLTEQDHLRKVVLFLGANIGNFTRNLAIGFLKKLSATLDPGDRLFIGFDLKKDPEIILNAYNDPAGITAAFNLNLLQRINRELEADFNIPAFKHWESYNPTTGETKSYLVSKCSQKVTIKALNKDFHFAAWESIEVELSLKYSLEEIESLARVAGFKVIEHFFDERKYFVDSLWEVMPD